MHYRVDRRLPMKSFETRHVAIRRRRQETILNRNCVPNRESPECKRHSAAHEHHSCTHAYRPNRRFDSSGLVVLIRIAHFNPNPVSFVELESSTAGHLSSVVDAQNLHRLAQPNQKMIQCIDILILRPQQRDKLVSSCIVKNEEKIVRAVDRWHSHMPRHVRMHAMQGLRASLQRLLRQRLVLRLSTLTRFADRCRHRCLHARQLLHSFNSRRHLSKVALVDMRREGVPLRNNRTLTRPLELRHRRVHVNWPQPGHFLWVSDLWLAVPSINVERFDR
mmetsp:Transcript_46303/g.108666  ORF Transcript_46303/g.108666 Transcript_46303/m.108666 type:complete len:277 (+) Transcript_46303:404-1234(+)